MTHNTEVVLDFPDFTVHTLAPGVHAVIAKRGTRSVGNSGIIDLGDRTLVFDTFMTVSAARELQKVAVELTGRPATYVVNSHPHPDHIQGNIAFGEEAIIVGTAATRADLLTSGPWFLENNRNDAREGIRSAQEQAANATDESQRNAAQAAIQSRQAFLQGLPAPDELRYPSITFEKKLTLHGATRTVELLTYGGGHSPSDAILWLPAERIAFTADLVVNGGHPFLPFGNPEEWLQILDEIDRLDPLTIVPGHGGLQPPAATAPVRQNIIDLMDLASRAARHGLSADQVVMPEVYRALPLSHVFTKNLSFLLERLGLQTGVDRPNASR